ncbi:MAG: HAMP domain-containing sensor histidine kinase, partial [Alistipes sp.]
MMRFAKLNIHLFLLFLCVVVPCHTSANVQSEEPNGCIVVISSYNPDTRRMSSFISEFEQQIVDSKIPYNLYVENLECRGVADAPIWMAQMRETINRYKKKELRAIVLLGQEAWASFVSLDYFPDSIQVFSCFSSNNGILLSPKKRNCDNRWLPKSVDFTKKIDNVSRAGGVLNKYDVVKNVDLIRSLYPEVENIAFVSDNTYGGISLQALVRQKMALYPDLNLILIDSREEDEVIHQKYTSLPAKSAVMIGTWRVGRDGQYLMQRSLSDLVMLNPSIPVFSITRTGFGDVAIGGYVPLYESGAAQIADQIASAYTDHDLNNTRFQITRNEYEFDSKKLKEWKIPEYALPAGSVVKDTMAAQLVKYSHYINLLITGLVVLVLMLVFVVVQFFRMRSLKRMLEDRERELVIAREKAEESDLLKSAFLANMSHEIRTPLNAIVGFSSLMESEDLSHEERVEYCSIVVNNSDMLLTLLNDILDVSSLECGKIKFNYASENIVQICKHVIMTTAHTRQAGVTCELVTSSETDMLTTDAHRLSQVLINLLTNAGKFTSQGSITLAIEPRPKEKMIYFSVSDTGPGIPLDKQQIVFNRFEKLAGNQKKGTGLGLAICYQIAAICGGKIWVDPDYTQGARFVFAHPTGITPSEQISDGILSGGGGFRESKFKNLPD